MRLSTESVLTLGRSPSVQRARWSTALAAVDLSGRDPRGARRVLRVARGIAEGVESELHVLNAWTLVGESILACPLRGIPTERLRALCRGADRVWRARMAEICGETLAGVEHYEDVVKGDPRWVVPRVMEEVGADVVVLGVPERGLGMRLLSRTVLDSVMGRGSCDVITVREPEDVRVNVPAA